MQTLSDKTAVDTNLEKFPPFVQPYYLDMGLKDGLAGMYDRFRFDASGVPLYPEKSGGDYYYNAAFIGNYALAALTRYAQFQRPVDFRTFVNLARWMADHGVETETTFSFPHSVPHEELAAGWNSCLHQGRVLSVLARLWRATGERRYFELCRKSVVPFEQPSQEGGVRGDFPDGGIGFEECPVPRHRLVLNGMISAMIGLFDFAELGPDTRSRELFEASVESLALNLHLYDLGYWSKYSIGRPAKPASFSYHGYHVIQLWMLHEITGRKVFSDYARKWNQVSQKFGCRMRAGLKHFVWLVNCSDKQQFARTLDYLKNQPR